MTEQPTGGKWRTSSRSSSSSCVEVKLCGTQALIRDSKNRDSAILTFDRAAFSAFIDGIRTDLFAAKR